MKQLLVVALGFGTLGGASACTGWKSPSSPDARDDPPNLSREPPAASAAAPAPDPVASRARPVTVNSYGALGAWDLDGNRQVELYEFRQQLLVTYFFADWDRDGDGELTPDEFSASLFEVWDFDDDGAVDGFEYNFGEGAWFSRTDRLGLFADWDADESDELSLAELRKRDAQLIEAWDLDGDGLVEEQEFTSKLFDAWDVNDDAIVDRYEFNRIMRGPRKPDGSRSAATRGSERRAPTVVSYGKFYSYDEDADSKVTLAEFQASLAKTSLFEDLQTVRDDAAESPDKDLRAKLFDFWDLDADERLDANEFKHGAGVFFPAVDTYGSFAAWDANDDGILNRQEFVSHEGGQRITSDWDKDQDRRVALDDLGIVVYEAWDENGDGQLELEEWRWW